MSVAPAELNLTSAAMRELGRNKGWRQWEGPSQAKVMAAGLSCH
jgi:hypothetical protein